MTEKTLDGSLRLLPLTLVFDKGMICQRSLDHKHPTTRDL